MSILPEKRSAEPTTDAVKRSRITELPEDSQPVHKFAQGNVCGNDQLVDWESDEDMMFDPPGSIHFFTDKDTLPRPEFDICCKDIPDYYTRREDSRDDYVAYCGICEGMTGHDGTECPYRCVARYENGDRCFKKFTMMITISFEHLLNPLPMIFGHDF